MLPDLDAEALWPTLITSTATLAIPWPNDSYTDAEERTIAARRGCRKTTSPEVSPSIGRGGQQMLAIVEWGYHWDLTFK